MTELDHSCSCSGNPLIPQICRVVEIRDETPDVKTFRVQTAAGSRPFLPAPGQLGMFSIPGVGEAMFSISAFGDDWIESSIKRVGLLTEAMHEMSPGDPIGLRGPYGNGFPVDCLRGNDILFIAGGIGLAPVRSLIRWCSLSRSSFGRFDIVCGARTRDDLPFREDLFGSWPSIPGCRVHITVDRSTPGWDGNVGYVPDYVESLALSPEGRLVVMCGPSIMIRLTSQRLAAMGYSHENIITSMETRMKCGIGKCGRCNIGSKFVCLDGPVFTLAELDELPEE